MVTFDTSSFFKSNFKAPVPADARSLCEAAAANDLEEVQKNLADKHLDVHTCVRINYYALPPLTHAVRRSSKQNVAVRSKEQLDTVRFLLDSHADVNFAGEFGWRALHYAESAAIVDVLLDAKANVNALNNTGRTPLMCAAMNGNTEVVARLLACKADPSIENADIQTALELGWAGQRTAASLSLIRGVWFGELLRVLEGPGLLTRDTVGIVAEYAIKGGAKGKS